MKFELDIHTHTVSSGHAYSTLYENAEAAGKKGLSMIAMTDHGPAMPGGAHPYHFHNMRVLPTAINGVRILKGVEANIIDPDGKLDLDTEVLKEMELVIASFHTVCIKPGTRKENTRTLRKVIDNPFVNIIGHPGDTRFSFDIAEIIRAASEAHVIPEINNSSLLPVSFRPGGDSMIREIILEALRQQTPLVLGSDAHYRSDVGNLDKAYELCRSCGFPDALILNCGVEKFLEYISGK